MAAAGKKVVKITKGLKKSVDNIAHSPYLSVIIPAGQAIPAPPLGTQLGQVIYLQLLVFTAVLRIEVDYVDLAAYIFLRHFVKCMH